MLQKLKASMEKGRTNTGMQQKEENIEFATNKKSKFNGTHNKRL